MYENNLGESIRRNKRRGLKKKKDKKLILTMFSVLLLVALIFLLKYFGIFPFSSYIMSYNRVNILIVGCDEVENLSLIHISEPTRLGMISYAVFCLKKKKTINKQSA